MASFDFSAPAELYVCRGLRPGRHPVRYLRFASAAEAIRFAIEDLAAGMLAGTVIEMDETRIDGAQIRALYQSADFPLPRTRTVGHGG